MPPVKISEEVRDTWRQRGWLVYQDLLPPEMHQKLSDWVEDISRPSSPGEERFHYFEATDFGHQLCRTERFLADHRELRDLLTLGEPKRIASELLGDPAIVYKEKVNYKGPGGAGFTPHQDATAYDFVKRHVTCLIAVDPMTLENGCLEFSDYGKDELMPTDGSGCIEAAYANTLHWRPIMLPAGGALFFTSYVPHRSGPNLSQHSRRALYITYAPASEGDLREDYYRNRDRLMAETNAITPGRISTIGHFQGKPFRQS